MRIKIKSIEYSGYNLIIYDVNNDYSKDFPPSSRHWYLIAVEDNSGKELFTTLYLRSPVKHLEAFEQEVKEIVETRFLSKVEPRSAVEIYTSDTSDYILSFVGESLADIYDYERALTKYRSDNPIFDILQPGQDILLEQGKFCLDDDLSLLVYE